MENIKLSVQEIAELLSNRQFMKLKEIFADMNSADIADFLKELSNEELLLAFRILPKDQAADTFVEMDADEQETLIQSFSDSELKAVVDDLFVDDAVDILEEMPAKITVNAFKIPPRPTKEDWVVLLKKL